MTKPCRFCAEEIQAAAILCRFCGRSQHPEQSERDSFAIHAIAGFLVFALALVIAYAATHEDLAESFYEKVVKAFSPSDSAGVPAADPRSAAFTPPPPPPPPPPLVQDIINNPKLRLEHGQYEFAPIELDDPRPCRLTGHVTVLDGGSRDVDVFLVDEDGLQNFRNGNAFDTYLRQQRTSAVTLNLWVEGFKQYYLIVSNTFSVFTGKSVAIENVKGICGGAPEEIPMAADGVE